MGGVNGCLAKRGSGETASDEASQKEAHSKLAEDKLTSLDISNFDDEYLESINEELAVANKLKKVKLTLGEAVTDKSLVPFLELVKDHHFIHNLKLHATRNSPGITSATFEAINAVLLENKFMKYVTLEFPGRGAEVTETVHVGLRKNRTLAQFTLCHSDLGDEEAAKFKIILERNASLHSLDLSKNSFSDKGVTDLCEGWKINMKLGLLNLAGNANATLEAKKMLDDAKAARAKRGRRGSYVLSI